MGDSPFRLSLIAPLLLRFVRPRQYSLIHAPFCRLCPARYHRGYLFGVLGATNSYSVYEYDAVHAWSTRGTQFFFLSPAIVMRRLERRRTCRSFICLMCRSARCDVDSIVLTSNPLCVPAYPPACGACMYGVGLRLQDACTSRHTTTNTIIRELCYVCTVVGRSHWRRYCTSS